MTFDFVVIGHQRSGSTYFSSLLSTHPEIRCYEELFNPEMVGIHDEAIQEAIGYRTDDVDKRDSHLSKFVAALMNATKQRLVGFKLFHDHNQEAVAYFENADVKRIILRRNLLASYSSWLAARLSNQWHSISGDPHAVAPRTAKVGFDPVSFFEWAELTEDFYSRFRYGRYIEVDYESLSDDAELLRIAEFLGCKNSFDRAKVSTSKVLSNSLDERFTNYGTVLRSLTGTRYASLLPDGGDEPLTLREKLVSLRAAELRETLVRHHVHDVKGIAPVGNFDGEHYIYLPSEFNGEIKGCYYFGRAGGWMWKPAPTTETFILSDTGNYSISYAEGGSIFILEPETEYHGQVALWNGGHVHIGRNSALYGVRIISDNSDILIADDVLMSDEVVIQGNDQHAILSLEDGQVQNGARRFIDISRHVWIGRRVMLLPNTSVGTGSIIGAGAIVAGTIEATSVAVGNPARVVKSNTSWVKNANGVPTDPEFRLLQTLRGSPKA